MGHVLIDEGVLLEVLGSPYGDGNAYFRSRRTFETARSTRATCRSMTASAFFRATARASPPRTGVANASSRRLIFAASDSLTSLSTLSCAPSQ